MTDEQVLPPAGPAACFFCAAELPPLEVAALPDAERIAFDPRLGRLWRVCGQCQRWNPVPLEDRWEVLEDCERLTRDEGDLLLSGRHLALYGVRQGQLVRVGEPPRVELADWRYSERLDEFPVRRPGWLARLFGSPVGGTWIARYSFTSGAVEHAAPDWMARPFIEHAPLLSALFADVPLADTCPACGGPLLLYPPAFADARLLLDGQAPAMAAACALCRAETAVPLPAARPALRAALGIVERAQRGTVLVRDAARPVERLGGPDGFIHRLAARELDVGSMTVRQRLGLWICLDEQAEAEALESEWRRAEELTAIFDRDLTQVPGFLEFRARVLALEGVSE